MKLASGMVLKLLMKVVLSSLELSQDTSNRVCSAAKTFLSKCVSAWTKHTRMRTEILTCAFGFFVLLSFVTRNVKAEPAIELEKYSYDLGSLSDGQIQKLHIPVSNTGTDVLVIDSVTSSCGCVEVESFDNAIPAGEKGHILITIDPSKAGEGQKVQRLLLTTNDSEDIYTTIDLYYRKQLPEVAVSPKSINVSLSKHEIKTCTGRSHNRVIISDTWRERLTITDIRTSSNIIVHFYDILYRCPTGSETHVLRFDTYLSRNLAPGLFREWITISTNHPEYPAITIPVSGEVESDVKLTPGILIARNLSEKETSSVKIVKVEAVGKDQILEIEDITCKDPWVKMEQIRVGKGQVDLKISIESPLKHGSNKKAGIIKSAIQIQVRKPDAVKKTVEIVVFCNKSTKK